MGSARHAGTFEVAGAIGGVFPLFSPEGEKLWVPGWDYENVMGTTELAEDHVFTTRSRDHATTTAVWVVKRYDPAAHVVEFYKVEPGDKVGVVRVACRAMAPDLTEVEVGYTYIALSPAGEEFIATFDEAAYADFIAAWESLLDRHFSGE